MNARQRRKLSARARHGSWRCAVVDLTTKEGREAARALCHGPTEHTHSLTPEQRVRIAHASTLTVDYGQHIKPVRAALREALDLLDAARLLADKWAHQAECAETAMDGDGGFGLGYSAGLEGALDDLIATLGEVKP